MGNKFFRFHFTHTRPNIKTAKTDLTKSYTETTKCHHQIKRHLSKPYTEKNKVYHKAKSCTETLKGPNISNSGYLDQTLKKTKFITKPENHKTKSNTTMAKTNDFLMRG